MHIYILVSMPVWWTRNIMDKCITHMESGRVLFGITATQNEWFSSFVTNLLIRWPLYVPVNKSHVKQMINESKIYDITPSWTNYMFFVSVWEKKWLCWNTEQRRGRGKIFVSISSCNSLEVWAPVDLNCGCLFFPWVAMAWLKPINVRQR